MSTDYADLYLRLIELDVNSLRTGAAIDQLAARLAPYMPGAAESGSPAQSTALA